MVRSDESYSPRLPRPSVTCTRATRRRAANEAILAEDREHDAEEEGPNDEGAGEATGLARPSIRRLD